MRIAQQLYEGIELDSQGTVGLITYMRTDSTSVSRQAQQEARDYITSRYGAEMAPGKPPVYRTKNKAAQEAHAEGSGVREGEERLEVEDAGLLLLGAPGEDAAEACGVGAPADAQPMRDRTHFGTFNTVEAAQRRFDEPAAGRAVHRGRHAAPR